MHLLARTQTDRNGQFNQERHRFIVGESVGAYEAAKG